MKFIRSDASHPRKSTKLKNNKDRIKNFLSIYSNYDRNYVFFKYLFYTLKMEKILIKEIFKQQI